jgi:hypothetical protein
LAKTWQFPFISSELLRFCLHLLKLKKLWKILKMLSGSSPIFALSNHTTCSQTQTGATVSLKEPNAQPSIKVARQAPLRIRDGGRRNGHRYPHHEGS